MLFKSREHYMRNSLLATAGKQSVPKMSQKQWERIFEWLGCGIVEFKKAEKKNA